MNVFNRLVVILLLLLIIVATALVVIVPVESLRLVAATFDWLRQGAALNPVLGQTAALLLGYTFVFSAACLFT